MRARRPRRCALYLIFCKGFLKFDYVRTRNVIFYCFLQGKADYNKTARFGPPRFVKGFLTKMMKTWLRPRRRRGGVHQGARAADPAGVSLAADPAGIGAPSLGAGGAGRGLAYSTKVDTLS